MISFDCEHCGESISFGDDWAGRMGRCTSCQQILEIPGQPEDSLGAESQTVSSEDTAELVLTAETKNAADETDILPAQGVQEASQSDPETVRNDADSWLRTYKQSKAIAQRRSYIRWAIIIAAIVVVIVLLLIIAF